MLLRITLALLIGGAAAAALGQSGTNDDQSIADRSPLENVRGGNVAARSPGNSVIRPALARHQGLMNDRLRGGGENDEESNSGSGTESTGTTGGTTSGSNDILSGLISSLTGGSVGGAQVDALLGLLGNEGVSSILGNSLGSLLGSGTTATTPSTTTPSGTTGTVNGATPTAAQQSSLELLLALRDQNLGTAGTSTSKSVQPASSATNANAGRGVVNSATSTKTAGREQSTGEDEEPTFRVRLIDSWLGTTFTALTVAASSRAFIDSIKDALRPVFGLPAPPPTSQPSSNSGGSKVRHFATLTERMAAVG